jgi:hypothetical protein
MLDVLGLRLRLDGWDALWRFILVEMPRLATHGRRFTWPCTLLGLCNFACWVRPRVVNPCLMPANCLSPMNCFLKMWIASCVIWILTIVTCFVSELHMCLPALIRSSMIWCELHCCRLMNCYKQLSLQLSALQSTCICLSMSVLAKSFKRERQRRKWCSTCEL